MTKPSVLVVEDNPVAAAMIRHFLDKSEYSIAGVVATGEEAISVVGECKPDLTLMDVELAGPMDGIEAADFHLAPIPDTGDLPQVDAVGRDLLEVFKVLELESRAPAECAVTEVIREGAQRRASLVRVLVARDGTESVVEETAKPIVNDRGVVVGVVLVFRPGTATESLL